MMFGSISHTKLKENGNDDFCKKQTGSLAVLKNGDL